MLFMCLRSRLNYLCHICSDDNYLLCQSNGATKYKAQEELEKPRLPCSRAVMSCISTERRVTIPKMPYTCRHTQSDGHLLPLKCIHKATELQYHTYHISEKWLPLFNKSSMHRNEVEADSAEILSLQL